MIILGQTWAIKSIKKSYDPTRGPVVAVTFNGTKDALDGIVAGLAPDQSSDMTEDGPVCLLTVTTPDYPDAETSESYTRRFELLGNDIERSIYGHPSVLALGIPTIQKIKDAVNKEGKFDQVTLLPESLKDNPTAMSVYKLIMGGGDSYHYSQYVYRVTTTISSRSAGRLAFANTNRIYNTAQMIAEAGAPPTIRFSLADIPALPAAPSGYMNGWLKKSPTVTEIAGQKAEVALEYVLETWSTFAYSAAS